AVRARRALAAEQVLDRLARIGRVVRLLALDRVEVGARAGHRCAVRSVHAHEDVYPLLHPDLALRSLRGGALDLDGVRAAVGEAVRGCRRLVDARSEARDLEAALIVALGALEHVEAALLGPDEHRGSL